MEAAKELLLRMLDEAFDQEAWHGANLMQTLGPLDYRQAAARSPLEGYCAWQVALHCAYWKWATRKSLDAGRIEPFRRTPDDWPALPESADAGAWARDRDLLVDEHRLLRARVEALSEEQLLAVQAGNRYPHSRSVLAIAAHDVYHTAMIRNMGVPGVKFS